MAMRSMNLTANIVLFKKTKTPGYLLKAICLIIQQRRSLEVIWSLYCLFRFRPSSIIESENIHELANRANSCVPTIFTYTRVQLNERFGDDYAINQLPYDFKRARPESIVLTEWGMIIGEYGEKSARIALIDRKTCYIDDYYNKMSGVRHIHSIHKEISGNKFYVSTGDGKKVLDRWTIKAGKLTFDYRVCHRLAGTLQQCA